MSNAVVLNGFGPHVRFKSRKTNGGSIRVVTRDTVKTVPLVGTTDVKFKVSA